MRFVKQIYVYFIETRSGFSNKFHVEQISIIFGGPLLGKLMDHSPRVPTFSCLAAVQVLFHSTLLMQMDLELSGCLLILLLLSDSCSLVICWDDNSCPYCPLYPCIICTSPSLVCCTSISWGCWETIWIGFGGCNGAWLGCAGSAIKFLFLMYTSANNFQFCCCVFSWICLYSWQEQIGLLLLLKLMPFSVELISYVRWCMLTGLFYLETGLLYWIWITNISSYYFIVPFVMEEL